MVRPLVIHECMEFGTRVFGAETTEFNILILRTLSKLTLRYILINSVTLTAIAVCCPTGTAVETTRSVC